MVVLVGPAPAWALAVFLAAAATDAVDGRLARARGESSAFGAFLDPLADKVLIVGTLVALAIAGVAPLWAVAMIGGREALVTAARLRGAVLAPSALARAKTCAQVLAVAVLLAGWPAEAPLLAAVALTLLSAASYAMPIRGRPLARAR